MNKFTKVSFCIVSVLVILVSMCPISAFASPQIGYYSMTCSKPTVTDHSGYAELVFRENSTGYEFCTVVSWSFIPTVSSSASVSDMPNVGLTRNSSSLKFFLSSDSGVSGSFSIMLFDSGNQYYYGVYPINSDQAQTVYQVDYGTGYTLVGAHYYGAYIPTASLNNFTDVEFYVTYSEDSVVCWALNEIINSLYTLISSSGEDWEYDYSSDLSDILTALNNLDSTSSAFREDYIREVGKLLDLTENVLSKIDETNVLLESIYQFLEVWIIDMHYWLQELYFIEADSNSKLYEIQDTLSAILKILQSKGESDFSEPDTSNLNGYYDTEHSLLDDSNVDTSQIFNVDLNENALSSIWNLVDKVLNVNPKVFGAVITILALGLIALILGR